MAKTPKEQPMEVSDLLRMPNLDDLLDDTKIQPKPKVMNPKVAQVPTKEVGGEAVPDENNCSKDIDAAPSDQEQKNVSLPDTTWGRFIINSAKYEQGYVENLISNYRIEQDILQTLNSLNAQNLNTTQLINCILRTFIEQYTKELRKMRRKRERSMLDL